MSFFSPLVLMQRKVFSISFFRPAHPVRATVNPRKSSRDRLNLSLRVQAEKLGLEGLKRFEALEKEFVITENVQSRYYPLMQTGHVNTKKDWRALVG